MGNYKKTNSQEEAEHKGFGLKGREQYYYSAVGVDG